MQTLKKNPASVKSNRAYASSSVLPRSMFSLEDVRRYVAELEVPFSPSLIEWRVMTLSEDGNRGQIVPYADQRAYTDRLNEIFTPAGWTRRYTVTTSASFERAEDKKLVAKVFVTCDLTIHGIGSHAATGEEWADNDNAGTSAEAQAFKRACSCFGLGRYLYNFTGIWVDLDERQRPRETPEVFAWATPQGWRQGLRPTEQQEPTLLKSEKAGTKAVAKKPVRLKRAPFSENTKLIKQIETMAEPLGKSLYRGLLKSVARVWKPAEISDPALLNKVLSAMQSAEAELGKLKVAQEKIGQEELKSILNNFEIKSVDRLNNLDTLQRLVRTLEGQSSAS
jgi:hypothetical protein